MDRLKRKESEYMFKSNKEDDYNKKIEEKSSFSILSLLLSILLGGIGIYAIFFVTTRNIPKIQEEQEKSEIVQKEAAEEFKQKTESYIIDDINKAYSGQTIFIAPKVRIIEWVHPETSVEYIIVESNVPGMYSSTSIAITPSLNHDGTVRIKK